MTSTDYTGLWITADHTMRKMLLPNGRFIVMVGNGRTHAQGEYRIIGTRIEYRKDSGFTGEGQFINGVLYSGDVAMYLDGLDVAAA